MGHSFTQRGGPRIGYSYTDGTLPDCCSSEGVVSPNTDYTYEFDFDYTTTSPLTLMSILAGKRLYRVDILVNTPFDVTTAASVGDDSINDRFLQSSAINLSGDVSSIWSRKTNYLYVTDTVVKLYLTPAGATVGSGTVFLHTNST